MKGNIVPVFVIVFAVGAVAASTVTGVAVSGISNLFTGASQSTDAEWVENTLGGPIANKCRDSGKQEPSPRNVNYTHSFNRLDNFTAIRDVSRKKTTLDLNYEGSSVEAVLSNADVLDLTRDTLCSELKLNGTTPDGSVIPRSDSIKIEDDRGLKFRVFETKYSGGWFSSNFRNITIQVRQD